VVTDDGAEEKRYVQIHGRHSTGRDLGVARVPLSAFPGMAWPVTAWGPSAVVSAGMGTKDRVREAIQVLSPEVRRRHVYTHTGWRLRDGVHYFLHAGGAIGAHGPAPDITVARAWPTARRSAMLRSSIRAFSCWARPAA
jgi:hypothetical protein